MNRYYLISFKTANREKIIQYIKSAGTWYKFDENSFIIISSVPFGLLNQNLNSYLEQQKDNLLIIEMSIQDYNGWQKKNVWDWFTTNNVPKR